MRKWKGSETKVAEDYCWAIAHVAGRSGCYRSRSSVLDVGFQPDSFTRTHAVDLRYSQLRLEQNVTVTRLSRAQILRKSGCVCLVTLTGYTVLRQNTYTQELKLRGAHTTNKSIMRRMRLGQYVHKRFYYRNRPQTESKPSAPTDTLLITHRKANKNTEWTLKRDITQFAIDLQRQKCHYI